jgi:glycosyltransferase involved in cell wall biosynthesis
LAVGRQTPYKKIDLAVAACTALKLPLTVVGDGPDHDKLIVMAGPTVTLTGQLPDEDVSQQFATAEAFIFPNLDDFGITPVEAMAAGTPVIAYKAGGALDYVIPGKTGEFFEEQTVQSLVKTLKTFKPGKYSPSDIKKHARKFSNENFQKKLSSYITSVLK